MSFFPKYEVIKVERGRGSFCTMVKQNSANCSLPSLLDVKNIIQDIQPVETKPLASDNVDDIVLQISQLSKEDLIQLLITKLSSKELGKLIR